MTTSSDESACGHESARALLGRLQAYMHIYGQRCLEPVRVAPFTAYFHPFDPLVFMNYAIPDVGAGSEGGGDLAGSIDKLRAVCRARGRTARLEYIDALSPDLEAALLTAGFRRESRARLMACPREAFKPAPAPEGLTITALTRESSLGEFITYCETGRRPFGDESTISVEEAEKARADLREGRALLGRINGEAAAAASLMSPAEGIAEIVGVGTLTQFRGRGVGAAIVSRAVEEAFERDVETLFLSTTTEKAGRLYERLGFRFVTSLLFMVDAGAAPAPAS